MTKSGVKLSLGAGSYDYDTLKKGTDAVAAEATGDLVATQSEMHDAVAKANRNPGRDADPRATPGYRFETRKGSTGAMERIQVPDVEDEAAKPASKKRSTKPGKRAAVSTGAPTKSPSRVAAERGDQDQKSAGAPTGAGE